MLDSSARVVTIILLSFVAVFLLLGCSSGLTKLDAPSDSTTPDTNGGTADKVKVTDTNGDTADEIRVTKDGTKYLVHPNKIRGGGPPKDGIPSIDNQKFVPVEEAEECIQDNELVLASI